MDSYSSKEDLRHALHKQYGYLSLSFSLKIISRITDFETVCWINTRSTRLKLLYVFSINVCHNRDSQNKNFD